MRARPTHRYPILLALCAQLLAALLLAAGLWLLAALAGQRLSLPQAAAVQALLALLIGWRLRLAAGWLLFCLLFVPALLLVQGRGWPPGWFLAGFLLLLAFNWNSLHERVPLYLTGAKSRRLLVERLAGLPADFRLVDLGCGLGGTLCQLARHYPQAQLLGVETAPLSFLIAWLRSVPLGNCRVRYRNLWHQPLQGFDAVYCFLSPAPMPALWRKAQAEMTPGSLLISNSFGIPGVAPAECIELHDWRDSRLLIWRL